MDAFKYDNKHLRSVNLGKITAGEMGLCASVLFVCLFVYLFS
jgi:hypothetical protein